VGYLEDINIQFEMFNNMHVMVGIFEPLFNDNKQEYEYNQIYINNAYRNNLPYDFNTDNSNNHIIKEILLESRDSILLEKSNCKYDRLFCESKKHYTIYCSNLLNKYIQLTIVDNTVKDEGIGQLKLYKDMLDNAKDIILLLDKDGRISYANIEAIKCYGYTIEELLLMNVYQLRSQDKLDFINQQFDIAKSKGIDFETIHFRKDGSCFFVEVKSMGVEVNNIKYVLSIVRDITTQRNDEQHIRYLANIVESSQDAIIGYDLNGIITSCNSATGKIYGYSKAEMVGKHISLVMTNVNDDSNRILQVIKNNENIELDRRLRKRKDGTKVYVSVQVSPIKDISGYVIGASAISRDITNLMAKEQELAQKYEELTVLNEELTALNEELTALNEELTANEEELRTNYIELELTSEKAEKANIAKNQFLANMSHELRTPMNGIMGIAELMGYTEINAEQKEYVQILKSSSEHLLEIINDLLDISKIEAGKLQLNNYRFNLRNNIDKLLRQVAFTAKNKGLEIMCSIDPLIGYEFFGDEVRLNQVLINLINNSIKFTKEGHIYVRLKKAEESKTSDKLEFSVEDTGIGIPEHFRKDIFKTFTQADYSNTRSFGGAGLGLAISKELVKMMDGDIWYESEEGKGSTFYFTVNLNKVEMESTQEDISKPLLVNDIIDTKILVAEDNDINKKIISGFLKNLKYKFELVENGREVIDALRFRSYDLILMDVQMPILNGIETTEIIRKCEENTGVHVPIIAMTAHAMSGDKENLIASGMDDYIAKPFDLHKLNDIIKKYIK
jgi:PAS domain S-box-containing protein